MSRVVLIAALLALAAPAAAQAQPPALQARLTACETGPGLVDRSASFTGSMPAVAGTRRMAMRFDLLQRAAGSRAFVPVAVPGLGVWQRSLIGKPGFVFTQHVRELAAPAAYQAVVRFRWYGRGGGVLRVARRETRVCRQPEMRPDLRAGRLDATDGPLPGSATYRLVVRNDGRSAAGAFDVALSVNDAPQPIQRLGGLGSHALEVVSFVAPRCAPGSVVRFVLDASSRSPRPPRTTTWSSSHALGRASYTEWTDEDRHPS